MEVEVHARVRTIVNKAPVARLLEIPEDALCQFPVASLRGGAVAAKNPNHIGGIRPSTHHPVHERAHHALVGDHGTARNQSHMSAHGVVVRIIGRDAGACGHGGADA